VRQDEGREIIVTFRRERGKDDRNNGTELTGYDVFWPSGAKVGLAFDTFCKIGLRYLFGKRLPERATLRLLFHALTSRDGALPRTRPHRVRILCLRRDGPRLNLCLPDGSPTGIVFHLDGDDPRVLEWVGAADIPDGGEQWFGLVAVPWTPPTNLRRPEHP